MIYRKYYGGRPAAYITLVLFASMGISGIVVDLLFTILGLIPKGPRPSVIEMTRFQWNYTTWLDIFALALVLWVLIIHFRKGEKAPCPHCQ